MKGRSEKRGRLVYSGWGIGLYILIAQRDFVLHCTASMRLTVW